MDSRFECGVTASLLSSGANLAIASHCAALIGAAGILLAHSAVSRAVFVLPVLGWPVACYFSVRVALDASLFRELAVAGQDGGPMLDELLHRHGFMKERPSRTISERCQGAVRLWRRLLAVCGIQVATSVAAILIEASAR